MDNIVSRYNSYEISTTNRLVSILLMCLLLQWTFNRSFDGTTFQDYI
ncbi:MAG: hypothetical protein N2712_02590 [Brevinematales bacterium]|nr:hypothetical protein [Brevinematales bacterium]